MLMRLKSARFAIAAALFFLSGMTGLAYEVLWVRMLGNQLGASQFGVIVTVCAFMLGLGVGALLIYRWRPAISRPLLAFAILEALIALHALSLPSLADSLTPVIIAAGGSLSPLGWLLTQVTLMVVVLLLPAMAMGASFPLIIRAASIRAEGLGTLYGLNACGAAIGALLPLLLLPWLGWATALQLVAALGICIAFVALLAACYLDAGFSVSVSRQQQGPQDTPRLSWLAYALIGLAAIMLEVAWSRFFSLLMLRTEYVLAIILAVYVAGIGLGALLGQRLPVQKSLNILPLLLVTLIPAGLFITLMLTAWFEEYEYHSLAEALFMQGGLLCLLTLPVTILLGAWLPLLHRQPGGAVMAGVQFYAWNALGSALGALLAGFILMPWLGTTAVISIAAVILFFAGLYWVEQWRRVLLLALLPIIALGMLAPFPHVKQLLPVSHPNSRDLFRFEDALAVTHVIENASGQRLLLSDLQRMDAASDPAAVASQKDQARLATWLQPAAKNILFLGLGTGITVAGAAEIPIATRLTAIELSRGAIEAASDWFPVVNDGVMSEVNVINDDIRRYLLTNQQHYDLIIGDLFHPDLVGRAALLSRQQFQRVRARLTSGGLYIQWLALNQFDGESLAIILRTFVDSFPRAQLFIDGFRLAMVGPAEDWPGLPRLSDVTPPQARAVDSPEDGWTWAGRYWGWPTLAAGPLEDEWRPQIEYSLPQARYAGQVDLGQLLNWLARQRPSLAAAAKAFHMDSVLRKRYERSFLATDLVLRSWQEGLRGNAAKADRLLRFAQQANPADRWISWTLADRMLASLPEALAHGLDERQALQRILAIMPGHPQTLAALWRWQTKAGNGPLAESLLQRLRRIDPLGYQYLLND